MIIRKEIHLLLRVISITFILMVLIFGFYSRKAVDDHMIVDKIREIGIIKTVIYHYLNWNGRWAAAILMESFLFIHSNMKSLIVFSLVVLSIQISSVFFCLQRITGNYLNITLTRPFLFLISTLISCQYFFFTFDIGESWFWISSTCAHFLAINLTLFGVGILLKKRKTLLDRIFYMILFLFAGGCTEPFAIIVCSTLFLNWGYHIFQKKTIKFSEYMDNIYPLLACTIGLLLMLFGPGEIKRQALFIPQSAGENINQQFYIIETIPVAISSVKHFIKYIAPLKIPYFCLFALSWIYFGHRIKNEIRSIKPKVKFFTIVVISFIIFFTLLSFSSWITAYGVRGIGSPRAWSHISFYLTLVTVITGLALGYFNRIKENISYKLSMVSISGTIVLIIYFIVSEYSVISAYAKAEDQRQQILEIIKSDRLTTSSPYMIVELDSLPSSGILKSNEIPNDSAYIADNRLILVGRRKKL